MADSGEKFIAPDVRYRKARVIWERNFTGTTAIHFGYKQVPEAERQEVAVKRRRADIAMGIMQRALRGM